MREGAERDCPEVVGLASKWVAEVLLEEFTDYTPPEPPPEEKAEAKEEAKEAPSEELKAEDAAGETGKSEDGG